MNSPKIREKVSPTHYSRCPTTTESNRYSNNNKFNTLTKSIYSCTDIRASTKSLVVKRENSYINIYLRTLKFPEKSLMTISSKNSIILSQDFEDPLLYNFDYIFTESNTILYEIYNKTVEPFIFESLNGKTTCFMTYGAIKTGKTQTMYGNKNDGIVYKSIEKIFEFENEYKEDYEIGIYMQFYQVNANNIQDLFNPLNNSLNIYEENVFFITSQKKGEIFIDNLTEVKIENFKDTILLINKALENNKNRQHLILSISFEKHDKINPNNSDTFGKIAFIDLAGAERIDKKNIKSAKISEEIKNINQSLSVLANIMNSLKMQQGIKHIPYRNSKLTRLLQVFLKIYKDFEKNYLNYDSHIAVLLHINPNNEFIKENLATFGFALRCKEIILPVNLSENLPKSPEKIPSIVETHKKELAEREKTISELLHAIKEITKSLGQQIDLNLTADFQNEFFDIVNQVFFQYF